MSTLYAHCRFVCILFLVSSLCVHKKNVGIVKGYGFVDIGQSGLKRNIAADERETSIAPSLDTSLGILLLKCCLVVKFKYKYFVFLVAKRRKFIAPMITVMKTNMYA
jgi:hypothetical protein